MLSLVMRHETRISYPRAAESKRVLFCFRCVEGLSTRTSRTSLHEVPLPNDGRRTGRLFTGRPARQRQAYVQYTRLFA